MPAFLHPQRDELVQPGAGGGVGVHVVGDVDSLVAGALDHVDDLGAVAVVAPVGYRQMGELDGDSRAPPDLDGLLHHLDVPPGHRPRVGHVEAAVAGGHLGQRHYLVGGGVPRWGKGQAGREAECALLHSLGEELLLDFELVGRGGPVVQRAACRPQGRVADLRRDVQADALRLHDRRPLVQVAPPPLLTRVSNISPMTVRIRSGSRSPIGKGE